MTLIIVTALIRIMMMMMVMVMPMIRRPMVGPGLAWLVLEMQSRMPTRSDKGLMLAVDLDTPLLGACEAFRVDAYTSVLTTALLAHLFKIRTNASR